MAEMLDRIADLGEPTNYIDLRDTNEGFRIRDLGAATWAMRKLVSIRRQQAVVRQTAEAEIRKLNQWMAGELADMDQSAAYFEGLLVDYHRHRLAEEPRDKTITLPHGSLKCRAQQPEYIRNEEELLAWAEATDPDNLVQVKKSARWSEIKQYGKAVGDQLFDPTTGEAIPGVTVIYREPKFTVDPDVEVV